MFSALARRKRAAIQLSPFFATAILTAAIFLLPPTGDSGPAGAAVDDMAVAATHISHDAGAERSSTPE
jgi:hypothetical protein